MKEYFDITNKELKKNGGIFINQLSKRWFKPNLILHRENGPALEWTLEEKGKEYEYYINGERHRDDGPAIEYADGFQQWWKNGRIHREDGPAITYSSGRKVWVWHGQHAINENQWLDTHWRRSVEIKLFM